MMLRLIAATCARSDRYSDYDNKLRAIIGQLLPSKYMARRYDFTLPPVSLYSTQMMPKTQLYLPTLISLFHATASLSTPAYG